MSVIPEKFDIDDLLNRASKITGVKPVRPTNTPLSRDEDLAVRTIIGEAKGEGEKGWEGVADVIRNRAKQSGKPFADVVLAPGQFEPWSSRKKELESYDPNSPEFQRVARTVLPVLRGERRGPAGDATHFYGPASQAALGRRPPSWDNGKGIDIGNHRFFNLGYSGKGKHGTGLAPDFDYSDLLSRADKITGLSKQAAAPVEAPVALDYTDLIARASALTSAPNDPPVKPVAESPETIKAQIQSALDPKSPRAAVLTTEQEQNAPFADGQWVAVPQPNGTLWVNKAKARKLKLRTDKDIIQFVEKNPNAMARLIGKVDDVGDQTSQGPAVLTTAPNGTELSASIVTSPESAKKQAEIDQASFPGSQSQVVDAQGVVAQRLSAQPGIQEQFPGSGRETIPISSQGRKQAPAPRKAPKSGTVTVSAEIGAPVLDDARASEVPRAWTAGEKRKTDDEILQGSETVRVNLKGVPQEQKQAVAMTQAVSYLAKKYGATPEAVQAFLAREKFEEDSEAGDEAEITFDRNAIAELAGGREPVIQKYREQESENLFPLYEKVRDNQKPSDNIPAYQNDLEGQPDEDPLLTRARENVKTSMFGIQGGDYEADVEAEYQRLKKYSLTEAERAEATDPEKTKRATDLGLIGSLFSSLQGASGRSLEAIAGITKIAMPEEWNTALSKFGQKMGVATEEEAKAQPGILNKAVRLVGGLAGDTPRFLLLSRLPGGMVSMFAVDHGLQSVGRGDRPETVAGQVLKGAVTGLIFKGGTKLDRAIQAGTLSKIMGGVPLAEKTLLATRGGQQAVSKVFGIGGKIGAISAGSAYQVKLEGGTNEEAFEAAISNALLSLALEHHKDIRQGAKALSGKIFRAKMGDKTKTVTVDENGDIVELKKEVPNELVDVEVAIAGPNSPVYAKPEKNTIRVFDENGDPRSLAVPPKLTPLADEIRTLKAQQETVASRIYSGPDVFSMSDAEFKAFRQTPDYRKKEALGAQIEAKEAELIKAIDAKKPEIKQGGILEQKAERNTPVSQAQKTEPPQIKEESTAKTNTAAVPEKSTEVFAKNKVFTVDKIAEAREILRKKGTQFNTGIDPESFKALGTIGAGYVEAGARKFADFSKRMVEEFGEGVKKHLGELYGKIQEEHAFEGMEKGISRVGQSIEAKAIEKGLTRAFGETAEYDKITIKDQSAKMADLLTDPERVKKIIAGEEQLPSDIRGGSFIKAVEDAALKVGDVETLQNLAKSKLTSDTSIHAQELRTLAERDPDSVVSRLRDVQQAREKAVEKRLGRKTNLKEAKEKEVQEMRHVVKKAVTKKQTWSEFVQSISCGY